MPAGLRIARLFASPAPDLTAWTAGASSQERADLGLTFFGPGGKQNRLGAGAGAAADAACRGLGGRCGAGAGGACRRSGVTGRAAWAGWRRVGTAAVTAPA